MSDSGESTPSKDGEHSPEELEASRTISSLPRFLIVGIGAFLVTCVVIFMGASLIAPDVEPGFPVTNNAVPQERGIFRITVDAADRQHWVPINLSSGTVTASESESDILVQRYVIRAPNGGMDLESMPIADAKVPADAVWTDDSIVGGQLQNPALTHWYSYSYFSHLLKSKEHTYAARLRSGNGIAYYQIVSYYCEPERTSCLTIDYRLEHTP